MRQRHGFSFLVYLACAATLLGHAWLLRQHDGHHDARTEPPHRRSPFYGGWDAPDPDAVRPAWSDELPAVLRLPPPLSTANYEAADSDEPADALRPSQTVRPLTRRQQDDQAAVRDVIEEEMQETSAEERDIWYEELKSLPAEAVRDLLKVRKQLRVLSPDHQLSGPSQLLPMTPPHARMEAGEIPAESIARTHSSRAGDWSTTRQALEQAITWSTHNLANAATPGYKRIDAVLGDTYAPSESKTDPLFSARGCRLAMLRLDMQPGKLEATGRPLDVAIDGEGFLIVRHEEFTSCYSRCGTLTWNSENRLCLRAGERNYELEPALTLPRDARTLSISPDGTITYQTANRDDPGIAGRIQLARFADPSQLIPLGNSLYAAAEEIKPVITEAVTAFRSGFLEQSNVNPEREELIRQTWESILLTLPSQEFPRTAREGKHAPN